MLLFRRNLDLRFEETDTWYESKETSGERETEKKKRRRGDGRAGEKIRSSRGDVV